MIVLDEQLVNVRIGELVTQWYRGRVCYITDLRPQTLIKDDSIPVLLHQVRQPTFVTINVDDFWQVIPASNRYCVVCVELPTKRVRQLSDLIRQLFRLDEFKTKATRMGKVVRVTQRSIQYYGRDRQVHRLPGLYQG